MAITRYLNDGTLNTDLAREGQLTAAILTELRARTMFVPGMFADANDGSVPNIILTKQINDGFSHRFEWFGADYATEDHNPGDEMVGQDFVFDKGTITCDGYIVKHFKTAKEDNNYSFYNPNPNLVRAVATGLAEELDTRAVLTCISAARTAALTKNGITIHPGGNAVTRVDANSTSVDDTTNGPYTDDAAGATAIDDDVANLAYLLDSDGIPDEGRYLVIHPHLRRILRHETTAFDKDYSSVPNDMQRRAIGIWHGFTVLNPYKRMPTGTNLDQSLSKYQIDCTSATGIPAALAFCGGPVGQSPVGYVQAAGLRGYMEVDETNNTNFMKGEIMCGFGVLHPQAAGIIQIAAA